MIKHFRWSAQASLPIFWSGKDAVKSTEEIRKQEVIEAARRMWDLHYRMRSLTVVERRKR